MGPAALEAIKDLSMEKRVVFRHKFLPYLLVAPQIVITLVFFIWPASQAIYQSALREDPFGLSSTFVGLENFAEIFTNDNDRQRLQKEVDELVDQVDRIAGYTEFNTKNL
ncbi:MAG: hypothetical protein R6V46_07355, partial [Desulfatiglandaceae bacterium]